MRNQILMLGITIVVTVIIIFAAMLFGINLSERKIEQPVVSASSSAPLLESGTVEQQPSIFNAEKTQNSSSIQIPGYETISLKSGQSEQSVNLYNPSENTCYFIISMQLPDGTEIYKSDLLTPGDKISSIRLTAPLQAGTYQNATIQYSCYSMISLKAVNGANVKFTLEVV